MRALIYSICFVTCLQGQDNSVLDRERVALSLKRMQERAKLKDQYLFERRMAKRELTADGKVKSQTVVTSRQDPWEEQVVLRVIQRDDKPLPPDELAKQEIKLQKSVIENRRKPKSLRFEEESWMDELPEALEFRKAGIEQRHGRPAEVYAFVPKPGYKARTMKAKAFANIRGKVWVDQADGEMTKLDVEVVEAISVGFGLLGKLDKGTHFEMERKKWDIGVWFEEWQRVRYDLRVLMVKSLRQEIETRWSNLTLSPNAKGQQSKL